MIHFTKNNWKKYLIENKIEGAKINLLTDLSDDSIKNFSCLCIVQHYKIKIYITKNYEKSLIPFIYDCQNKLTNIPNSKTILKPYGSS